MKASKQARTGLARFLARAPNCTLPLVVTLACETAVSFGVLDVFFRPGLLVELSVVAYFSTLFATWQRRRIVAALLFSVASAGLYAVTVAKYAMLHETISLLDLASIDETLFVLPGSLRVFVVLAVVVWVVVFLTNLRRPSKGSLIAAFPILVYALLCVRHPAELADLWNALRPHVEWRRELDVMRHGPWPTLLRQIPEFAALYASPPLAGSAADPFDRRLTEKLFAARPSPPPNLYVLQLESFVDPRNFRGSLLSADPMDPRLRRWLDETGGPAVAPTFGGLTAAAEFEVLCGTPSLRPLGVEFNVLSGAPIDCLPRLLSGVGYATIASVPAPRWYFNIDRAYRSLGFGRTYAGDAFETMDMDGSWLSDDSFFAQSKPRVEALLAGGQPFFGYFVTAAGHAPFAMNPALRPPRFADTTWAGRIANATTYTSTAVADFIEWIEGHDPAAVVIAFGDHLPPLEPNEKEYAKEGYRVAPLPSSVEAGRRRHELHATPLIVRSRGRSIALGPSPHHTLGALLLDLLLDGAYCKATQCPHESPIAIRPYGGEAAFTSRASFPDDACPAGNDDPDCAAARAQLETAKERYWSLLRQGTR